jgi:hypothetical protein
VAEVEKRKNHSPVTSHYTGSESDFSPQVYDDREYVACERVNNTDTYHCLFGYDNWTCHLLFDEIKESKCKNERTGVEKTVAELFYTAVMGAPYHDE